MNKFLFLACLAVLGCSRWAAARPDLSRQAYRYEIGQNDNLVSGPVVTTSTSYQPTASGNTYYNNLGGVNSGFVPSAQVGGIQYTGSSGYTNGISTGSANGNGIYTGVVNDHIGLTGIRPGPVINYKEQEAYISHLANFQPPIISKHFYLHTAPEDHDEQQIVRYVNVGKPQKNYRVVFINAPASTTSKAKIIANVAPVEEKTAIYVLSKKSNALDVSAEVVTQRPVTNKPEVYFIKYKTPAEAAHAQQTIQANYDALGGSSSLSDEGIVPTSSVINALGDNGASGVINDGSGSINIVGTGGVPINGVGVGVPSNDNLQIGISAGGNGNQVATGTSNVGSSIIQTSYLPAKPIRSVKY
ncbi:hypothetical protein AWZ03_009832 [Drosophila navojoa]|uniref:DUF243 domain-containing protein n=1 Tax=Drosophila navojoa TaxID=7232 RepID=A0A484B7G9_DRONA|nr:uncharacterized protein LOC108657338 [Drosophila navojoa]TDG43765.1 hypothetical protein AWZ03_009832 [Drosophila navojoa]